MPYLRYCSPLVETGCHTSLKLANRLGWLASKTWDIPISASMAQRFYKHVPALGWLAGKTQNATISASIVWRFYKLMPAHSMWGLGLELGSSHLHG